MTCPQIEETIIKTLKKTTKREATQSDILVLEMQLDFNQLKKTTIFCSACETRLFNAPFSKTITYSPSKLAANPFWQNFVSIKRSMHDWLEPKTTVIIPIPNWEKNSKRQFFLLRASTEIDMLAFENGQIIYSR